MHEFDSVSVSTFEASTLAAKLTERSREGWDVVAVVPTGSDVTAFLRRAASATESTAAPADTTSTWDAGAATTAAAATATSEPAGWGSAPETGSWGNSTDASSTSSWGAGASTPASASSWESSSAAATPAAPTPTAPAVPAGWYSDPALRFELRYWDGSAWTEHVSRAGQQFTDPPVA